MLNIQGVPHHIGLCYNFKLRFPGLIRKFKKIIEKIVCCLQSCRVAVNTRYYVRILALKLGDNGRLCRKKIFMVLRLASIQNSKPVYAQRHIEGGGEKGVQPPTWGSKIYVSRARDLKNSGKYGLGLSCCWALFTA